MMLAEETALTGRRSTSLAVLLAAVIFWPGQAAFAQSTPAVVLSQPSVPGVNRGSVVRFTATYQGATSITLKNSDLLISTSGTAALGTVTISGSGLSSRTITLSSLTGDGTVTLAIAPGTARGVGQASAPGSSSSTVKVDNTDPQISVGAASRSYANGSSQVTFDVTYSGVSRILLAPSHVRVNGAGISASITVTGTSAPSADSGTATRTITVSGLKGNGNAWLTIASGSAVDAAGNSTPAAGSSSTTNFVVDTISPAITLTGPTSPMANSSSTISYELAWTGADLGVLSDANKSEFISLTSKTGATAQVTVSGSGPSTRTITLSGFSGGGVIQVGLAAGTAADFAGNKAPAPKGNFLITVDTDYPTVTIGPPSSRMVNSSGVATFDITFSKAKTITLTSNAVIIDRTGTANATASVTLTGPKSAKVRLTGFSGNGTVGILIPAAAAVDSANNASLASANSQTILVDTVPPSFVIEGPSVSTAGPASSVSYDLVFSDSASVTTSTQAIVTNFTGTAASSTKTLSLVSPGRYRFSLTQFRGTGTLSIQVKEGFARDAAGNASAGPAVSDPFTVTTSAGLDMQTGKSSLRISKVLLSSPAGTAKDGTQLVFSVTTSEPVVVSGTPQFPFKIGTADRTATYSSGSGSATLVFRYTIGKTDIGPVSWPAGSLSGGSITYRFLPGINLTRDFTTGTSTVTVAGTVYLGT
ncbi:hypothetical protein EBZ80_19420, partial [bacterium]|nr:hypothetical protein [bacterium]